MRRVLFGTLVLLAGLLVMPCGLVWSMQYHDDFNPGGPGWSPGAGWDIVSPSEGENVYRCDYNGDTFAWQTSWMLDDSWAFQADMDFQKFYDGGGTLASGDLAFSANKENPSVSLLVDVIYSTSQSILVRICYLDGDTWYEVLKTDWMSGADKRLHVRAERQPGNDYITVTITDGKGFSYNSNTTPIPQSFLDSLSRPGLRTYLGAIDFDNVDLVSPLD